jgi:hypothetical protein
LLLLILKENNSAFSYEILLVLLPKLKELLA